MSPQPKFLIWIDLETAGTDPVKDPIIEIAAIITTPTLHELDRFERVIRPDGWRGGNARPRSDPSRWPPVVREMHAANGLIEAIDHGEGWQIRGAEQMLIAITERYGKAHDFLLAGSGVSHFDRQFIKAQMPNLERLLQYPNLDIGVARRMWGLWAIPGAHYPAANEGKNHRAMVDIECHLDEARWWYETVRAACTQQDT